MPKQYEVHWTNADSGEAKNRVEKQKNTALAIAALLREQGHLGVRVLQQIDPPQGGEE
jgi:hypothetical protein